MPQHRERVAALVSGVVFGIGLLLSGMTQPSKVIGFLDVGGSWDPSLMFVMGGAIAIYMPLNHLIRRRTAPLFSSLFRAPTRDRVDASLVTGAVLFGVGWGLLGYCPGPALAAFGSLSSTAILFVVSMVAGFALKRVLDRRRSTTATDG